MGTPIACRQRERAKTPRRKGFFFDELAYSPFLGGFARNPIVQIDEVARQDAKISFELAYSTSLGGFARDPIVQIDEVARQDAKTPRRKGFFFDELAYSPFLGGFARHTNSLMVTVARSDAKVFRFQAGSLGTRVVSAE